MNENIVNTAHAIGTAWRVAHNSETKKDAIYRWTKILSELSGMWNMANWVLHCDETMEFISELEVIARIHLNRVSV